MPEFKPLPQPENPTDRLSEAILRGSDILLSHQHPDGYWWYTLEANESINAEVIFLYHYLGAFQPKLEKKISTHILNTQTADGSWPLYFKGPGDLSTTIECYWALKLSGQPVDSPPMIRARQFIRDHGGITKCRIFTRIHLALFGLLDFKHCPEIPLSFIQLPAWAPINIYEFSSWARACIVPLLVLMHTRKVRALPPQFLDELYLEENPRQASWKITGTNSKKISPERFFIILDKLLKQFRFINLKYINKFLLKKCEIWIREHVSKTEDIYPALAYAAMALSSMGYSNHDPMIEKCLEALTRFQMEGDTELSPLPFASDHQKESSVYQQCCISPVWDTPWAGVALLEAGVSGSHPELRKSGRWLLTKQILNTFGDWHHKNSKALPGGWAFEFENEYFPDVDDTIQVMHFLSRLEINPDDLQKSIQRGTDWVLSMQSANGGWGAFDKDNTLELVNRIPFSDHKACLDPPSPDLTGRVIEFLGIMGHRLDFQPVQKAVAYLEKSQEPNGSWWARWAVNYLFGTASVLQGFQAIGYNMQSANIRHAVNWLKSVQRPDGGFGESCDSYSQKKFVGLDESVASQTAWALLGLVAAGEHNSPEATKAADFLIQSQNADGTWEEKYHTGTGFPGHFYIRYHGYRHFFPVLALAKYKKAVEPFSHPAV